MSTGQRDRSIPDPNVEPTITIPRAGRILGMSRNAAYAAARDGRFPTIELSATRRVVLTADFLERYRLRRVPTAPANDSTTRRPSPGVDPGVVRSHRPALAGGAR